MEGTGGEPTGEMTYRTNPNTGDKVSLLGYGCMRWPMKKDENGKDIVDQEKVNELVDYAIERGVNFLILLRSIFRDNRKLRWVLP